jgi:hypothetical protein
MTKLAASLRSTPEQPAQRDEVGERAEERSMEAAEPHGAIDRQDLARIGFLTIAAVFLWTANPPAFVGGAATLIGGYPIFKEAIEHLRERRMTMELSMTLALGAALVIGEAFTAVVITTFVLAAEILEGLTVSQGRQAIRYLLDLLPQRVRVRRDGEFAEIAAADLCIGDAILIRPGERVPVDGAVIHGESHVDQAAITGEPTPVRKQVGAQVFAGTVKPAPSRFAPTASAATRASGRSLTQSSAPISVVRRFRKRPIVSPRISSTSPRRLPLLPSSSLVICDPRFRSSSSRAPAVSRRAHRWPFWVRLVGRLGWVRLSKVEFTWKRSGRLTWPCSTKRER